ncbi:MAG: hypothetical protein IT209_00390 [Armatimonadetes bacterium]|nr:hypothetical protein [Armatimonadota bacterium]
MRENSEALVAGLALAAVLQSSIFYFQLWRPRLERMRLLQGRSVLSQWELAELFAIAGASGLSVAANLAVIGRYLHVHSGCLRPTDRLADLYCVSPFAIKYIGLIDSDIFRCKEAIRDRVERQHRFRTCLVGDVVEQLPLSVLLSGLEQQSVRL